VPYACSQNCIIIQLLLIILIKKNELIYLTQLVFGTKLFIIFKQNLTILKLLGSLLLDKYFLIIKSFYLLLSLILNLEKGLVWLISIASIFLKLQKSLIKWCLIKNFNKFV